MLGSGRIGRGSRDGHIGSDALTLVDEHTLETSRTCYEIGLAGLARAQVLVKVYGDYQFVALVLNINVSHGLHSLCVGLVVKEV